MTRKQYKGKASATTTASKILSVLIALSLLPGCGQRDSRSHLKNDVCDARGDRCSPGDSPGGRSLSNIPDRGSRTFQDRGSSPASGRGGVSGPGIDNHGNDTGFEPTVTVEKGGGHHVDFESEGSSTAHVTISMPISPRGNAGGPGTAGLNPSSPGGAITNVSISSGGSGGHSKTVGRTRDQITNDPFNERGRGSGELGETSAGPAYGKSTVEGQTWSNKASLEFDVAASRQKFRDTVSDLHYPSSGIGPAIDRSIKGFNLKFEAVKAEVVELTEAVEQSNKSFHTSDRSVHGRRVDQAKAYRDYVHDSIEATKGPKIKQQRQLVTIADVGLEVADESFGVMNIEEGELALGIAYEALDFALSITPGVGIGKDLFEVMTGHNLVTGIELSSFELTIGMASIATLGLGKPIVAISKVAHVVTATAVKLAKKAKTQVVSRAVLRVSVDAYTAAAKFTRSPKAIKAYAPYHKAFSKMPAKLQPKQIKAGTNGRIALIGRSMGKRGELIGVLDAKEVLEANGWAGKVDVFWGDGVVSQKATAELRTMKGNFPDGIIDNETMVQTKMFEENMAWVDKVQSQGNTIIDLGNPNELPQMSVFYQKELERIKFDR